MDIHHWLQNTADRQPPDEEDHPGFPAFLKPQRPPEPKRREHREQHRKRKRASSEPSSSEIHHRHRRKRHQAATSSSSSSDHARRLQPAAASSRSSSHASRVQHARDEAGGEVHGEVFERRARHKTRPDRYEAKPKKRSKGRQAQDEQKSRSKRRKSNQSADVARAKGKISSFQLKNGRKDKRLTLRPDVSAGIFKHGRASAAVATNGPGLPDLVFNEMKFLQRPTEHQDETPVDEAGKNRPKKSKQQLREEEISAYFAKKPTAEETFEVREDIRPLDQGPDNSTSRNRQIRHPPPREDGGQRVTSPIELPEKPFLGFGSKGPNYDSSNLYHPESNTHNPTSYLTWSESVVGKADPPPQRMQLSHSGQHGDHEMPLSGPTSSVLRHQALAAKQRDHPTTKPSKPAERKTNESHGIWVESRRGKGPSHVKVYQPPNEARPSTKREARFAGTHESSDSLPRAYPMSINNDRPDLRTHHDVRDHRTSDVLKLVGDGQIAEPSSFQQMLQHPFDDKENTHHPSTPTSDVLRRAFHAVTNQTKDRSCKSTRSKDFQEHRRTEVDDGHVDILDTGYRPPSHAHRSNSGHWSNPQPQVLPQRGFSRSTEASSLPQNRQPLGRVSASRTNIAETWRPPPTRGYLQTKRAMEDEEMLDNVPSAAALNPHHYGHTDSRELEDLVYRLNAEQEQPFVEESVTPSVPLGYEGVDEALDYDAPVTHVSTDWPSIRTHSAEEDGNGVQMGTIDDDMNGFWRPNILY